MGVVRPIFPPYFCSTSCLVLTLLVMDRKAFTTTNSSPRPICQIAEAFADYSAGLFGSIPA